MGTNGVDIFISYARKDLSRVEPIARMLRSLGYRVWWDAALRAGTPFDEEIEKALAAALCVLADWSEAAVGSRWVRAEATAALHANKLVPVFLEPVKPPVYFINVHGVDLSGWDGRAQHDAFQRLIENIAELVGPGGQGPAVGGPGSAQARRAPDTGAKVQAPETASAQVVLGPRSFFRYRLKDGSEGPEMVWLPPGRFFMGSPDGDKMADDNERPLHEVRIARPFAIGRFPVTFADYDRFCIAAGRKLAVDEGWGRGRRPAIHCSWEDAVAYCRWLSGQTRRAFRLPSEAEWEYACRAGTPTRWSCGDEENVLGECAWFKDNSGGQTHPVGEKAPNRWGLHDLHGIVWEWVLDHWHDSYRDAPYDGRAWEEPAGGRRVLRGGSWFRNGRLLRSAYRGRSDPGYRYRSAGFRLVLGPQPGS